jgi:hypothetical protein
MSKSVWIGGLVLLVTCFSSSRSAWADEAESNQDARTATRAAAQDKKAVLVDATRVSTDKAVESSSKQKSAVKPDRQTRDPIPESDVIELHPASQDRETGEAKPAGTEKDKKTKRGPLRDVHGTIYGAAGSAGDATGAAVGASTRSGKTGIYIETQQEKGTNPRR